VKASSGGAEEWLGPNDLIEKHAPSRPVLIGEAAVAFTFGQISNFSQDLLQELPVAVYTTDAEGRITSFNKAAVALWGCRPELGKSEYCGSYRLYWPDRRWSGGERECASKCKDRPRDYARHGVGMIVQHSLRVAHYMPLLALDQLARIEPTRT
jgi:hypothetical protein